MKSMPNNTGTVRSRYVKQAGNTTLTMNFRRQEAALLRSFKDSVRLRGDKVPTMALIARRAVLVYLAHAQYSPETTASEIEALEKLATPFSNRAPTHCPAP
jgi:hypothetical protein